MWTHQELQMFDAFLQLHHIESMHSFHSRSCLAERSIVRMWLPQWGKDKHKKNVGFVLYPFSTKWDLIKNIADIWYETKRDFPQIQLDSYFLIDPLPVPKSPTVAVELTASVITDKGNNLVWLQRDASVCPGPQTSSFAQRASAESVL